MFGSENMVIISAGLFSVLKLENCPLFLAVVPVYDEQLYYWMVCGRNTPRVFAKGRGLMKHIWIGGCSICKASLADREAWKELWLQLVSLSSSSEVTLHSHVELTTGASYKLTTATL